MDLTNTHWIVGLFMELADPTDAQRLIVLSLFTAEIDHQLENTYLMEKKDAPSTTRTRHAYTVRA